MMTHQISSADRGYFPEGKSVLRKVHGEQLVGLFYGQVALLMQAADPLTWAGFATSTNSLGAIFDRLARTAQTMEIAFFGSRAETDAMTARVREMHRHVKGTIKEPARPHPVGTRYSADNPTLSVWVLACLAYASLTVYKTFIGKLSRRELKQFWDEYKDLGVLFGIPRSKMPATYDDFQQYMRDRLASGALQVNEQAWAMGRQIALAIPMPVYLLPVRPVINFTATGLLPKPIRELYDLSWSLQEKVAFHLMAQNIRRFIMPFVPSFIRQGQSSAKYALVSQTEQRRQK